MQTIINPSSAATLVQNVFSDILSSPKFLIPFGSFIEYAGAALDIFGWLGGIKQIGSPEGQQIGFLLWIIGGILLIIWGYHTKARALMAFNVVNTVIAASALVAVIRIF
mgnify:CR=1 FL=1